MWGVSFVLVFLVCSEVGGNGLHAWCTIPCRKLPMPCRHVVLQLLLERCYLLVIVQVPWSRVVASFGMGVCLGNVSFLF